MDFTKVKVLVSEKDIAEKVRELGAQISADYEGKNPIFIGVLKGAYLFMSDLTRHVSELHSVDFIQARIFGQGNSSTGICRLLSDISENIEGRNVILVEDIVDSGTTISFLINHLMSKKPASLKICTLLHKPARTRVKLDIDYKGFTIQDSFVFGYGLDFDEKYRNLPYIGVITLEEV